MPRLKVFHLCLVGAAAAALFGVLEVREIRAEDRSAAPSAASPQNSATKSDVIIAEGEALYARRCGACHSLDANRIGPRHRGVCGRRAGSLEDYDYSPALTQSELAWNAQSLDAWLQNPEAAIPGQKMGFRLGSQEERDAIIAFLCALPEN